MERESDSVSELCNIGVSLPLSLEFFHLLYGECKQVLLRLLTPPHVLCLLTGAARSSPPPSANAAVRRASPCAAPNDPRGGGFVRGEGHGGVFAL